MKLNEVKFDCRYFRGEMPCQPNKERNKLCNNCDEYIPVSKRILIIKLGAIGDVIRTTPLVERFKKMYPNCHITWITNFPDILPKAKIDKIMRLDSVSVLIVKNKEFDIVINLDKDFEACALLTEVSSAVKYGFLLNKHIISPATPAAEHKLMTGFFDSLSKENTKSYLEEIFEICHLKFEGEEYLMDIDEKFYQKWQIIREKADSKKVIGLNTGCGARWLTRLWPEENWIELIFRLQQNGYYPLILGGPEEDTQNRIYAEKTDAWYPGTFSLKEFIAMTAHTDLVITAVSMMMHIATALKKPMLLFVNIFNKHEFELYGRGEIIEPLTGCDCFYGNTCSRERNCMQDISVETVYQAIVRNVTE